MKLPNAEQPHIQRYIYPGDEPPVRAPGRWQWFCVGYVAATAMSLFLKWVFS